METSPAFSEGKSECRVRVFLESGFCTGPSPGPSPSPVRVSQYADNNASEKRYSVTWTPQHIGRSPRRREKCKFLNKYAIYTTMNAATSTRTTDVAELLSHCASTLYPKSCRTGCC